MILNRIEQKYAQMSAGQKRIADFISGQLREAVYMNAKELSEHASVSESGVIRFAAFLEYSGFKEMQRDMQDAVKTTWSIMEVFQNAMDAEETEVSDSRHVYNQAIKNLNETIAGLPEELFEEALQMMLKARHIGVVGTRVSVASALTLQILLNQLLPDVRLLIPGMDSSFDTIQGWGKDDLLIGFSFMRNKNFIYDIMAYGKEKGCKSIAICDSYRNSIANLADLVFPVQSNAAFLSLVPTMYVIDTLLYKASKCTAAIDKHKLEDIEQIINRFVGHD